MIKLDKKNLKRIILSAIALAVVVLVASVSFYHVVEETGSPEYCKSCHEMQFFYDTWEQAPHGASFDGTRKAVCADCHLPHEGTPKYIIAKTYFGVNDVWAHFTKRNINWLELRDRRIGHVFDSGCKQCHTELVAAGIPLKAIMAHRDYNNGQTEKRCVDCHLDVGHGDLTWELMEKEREEQERMKE